MKQICVIVCLHFLVTAGLAQNNLIKQWDHSLGGMGGEGISKILPTFDGGFLVAGASNSDSGYEVSQGLFDTTAVFPFGPTSDVWLIKCDGNGIKQWDVRLGGIQIDEPTNIIQTTDKGFALTAITNSPISYDITQPEFGANDFWIVKLDTTGNILWQSRFGGDSSDIPTCILELPSGGFLIGGASNSSMSGTITQSPRGSSDMYLLEVDANGNQVWDKRYGGNQSDYIASIIPSQSGGYFLIGVSASDISGEKTQNNYISGEGDIWIVKTDSSGNYISDKIIGSLDNEYGINAVPFVDDGFIIGCVTNADAGGDKTDSSNGTGTSTPFDSDRWIIRMDSTANIVWNKTVGGVSSEDDNANLFITTDNNILISGTSYSDFDPSCIWKNENNIGPENLWLVTIDQNGDKLWDKTVLTGYAHTEAGFGVQLDDGCFVFGDNGDALIGGEKTEDSFNFDYWVIKFCDTSNVIASVPTAGFRFDLTNNCNRVCFSFNDTTNNSPTSWSWTFNGAQQPSSNNKDPDNICYDNAGIYTVTFVACNAAGCDSSTNTISVTEPSMPEINIAGDTVLCGTDTIVLNASNRFNSYNWRINNSLSTVHDSVLYATLPGIYEVSAANTSGCIAVDTVIIYATNKPHADFTISTAANCEGVVSTFHNNSTDALNFNWDFGDFSYSSETNPSHIYSSSNNEITITLIAKNLECADTFSLDTNFQKFTFNGDSIPNVFTPNNDSKNDCFSITASGDNNSCFVFKIFNRWGEMVFQSDANNFCWNGKLNNAGPEMAEGVYFYSVIVRERNYRGYIELLR